MPDSDTASKVLIVDDEPEILVEVVDVLEDAGFSCFSSTDPKEAIDIARAEENLNIIVTDLKMPGMSGLEMARAIAENRGENQKPELIVVTGHGDTAEAIKALRLGASDFLSKPVSPDHLVHAVERCAEIVRLKRLEIDFIARLEEKVERRTAEARQLAGDLGIANRELHSRNQQLFHANQVKSNFLSLMSHELRTPLNAVIGFSRIMASLDDPGGAEVAEYSGSILRAGEKLLRIINTILELIDVEAGDVRLKPSDFDLGQSVERILEVYSPGIEDKNLTLVRQGLDVPNILNGDSSRIGQAIGHILDNAIKFSPDNGELAVRIHRQGKEIWLSISDQGKGMTREEVSLALEPFEQVDSSNSKTVYGIGAGLTLARIFIELHNGRLEMDSAPDQGTTVTLCLPM